MSRINLKAAAKKAKAIRRRHPSMKWTTAMSEAMKSMSKKGGSRRKLSGTKKRFLSPTKKKRRSATIRKVKRLHKAEGRAIRSLGSVSAHLSRAKKMIEDQIARSEVTKFKARTSRLKRKSAKRIAELKSRYRKLC